MTDPFRTPGQQNTIKQQTVLRALLNVVRPVSFNLANRIQFKKIIRTLLGQLLRGSLYLIIWLLLSSSGILIGLLASLIVPYEYLPLFFIIPFITSFGCSTWFFLWLAVEVLPSNGTLLKWVSTGKVVRDEDGNVIL